MSPSETGKTSQPQENNEVRFQLFTSNNKATTTEIKPLSKTKTVNRSGKHMVKHPALSVERFV